MNPHFITTGSGANEHKTDGVYLSCLVTIIAYADNLRPIAVGALWPWAVFAGLLLLLAIYFVGAEEGRRR